MTWSEIMAEYLASEKYKELEKRVCEEYKNHQCFPPKDLIYNALKLTPYDSVSCLILGQDPYFHINQAMGLSFSVNDGVKIPPSLINIYKEINNEFGYKELPTTGNLIPWAKQGVLLLNAILSVRANEPTSHKNIGWEECTNEIIKAVNKKSEPVVYMLWGNFAKQKAELITNTNHLILTAAHPSPLARGAFFGCDHFKKCNDFLKKNGMEQINWRIN